MGGRNIQTNTLNKMLILAIFVLLIVGNINFSSAKIFEKNKALLFDEQITVNDFHRKKIVSKNIEQIIDPPINKKNFSLVNFVSDLFLIKTWGMIYWIWLAGIVSLSSLLLVHNPFLTEVLRPLIWFYAVFSPLGSCYIIYKVIKNKIPDKLVAGFNK